MIIKIGKKIISRQASVFIIAEAGVNHNGSLATALKLIDEAAAAGADAVKFQTFKAEQVVTHGGVMADYQKKNIGKNNSQLAMLEKLELPENFYPKLIKRCREKKIIFLSTPHGSFASVDLLERLGVSAFKFGSGDLNNLPLLKYAAKFKKPMIISTGMGTMTETSQAIKTVKQAGNNKIIALHCTTNYPCPPEEVNLAVMKTMVDKLDVLVGYSDHTRGAQTAVMAATLGACLIEKHFTLDRNMPGPDHQASCEPAELKDLVSTMRNVKIIMGSKIKKPTAAELKTSMIARKSVVAIKDIKAGEKFSRNNIDIKRPGSGLAPEYYFKILGKTAKREIKNDSLLKYEDYR